VEIDGLQNSILLIDKPSGITSFKTIETVKRMLKVKKIGHSGTLDKFASGLLVVCTGGATKLTRYFLEEDKEYFGVVQMGFATDTDDCEGTVVEENSVNVTEEEIRKTAQKYAGAITQMPPTYSALKVKGKRASDLAREGAEVNLKSRDVFIKKLDVGSVDFTENTFSIDVDCTKGTYIRSLARDIGRDLGTGAYLKVLRRLKSGCFSVEDAVSLKELEAVTDGVSCEKDFVVPLKKALGHYSKIVVSNSVRERVLNGAYFTRDDAQNIAISKEKRFLILDENENVIAIADIDIEKWHIDYCNIIKYDIA
jgi:tRNA pseudouridine55 synthase